MPARKVKFENYNKTLKILNVSEEDAGEYICMANNHLGSIRHSIFVQVKGEREDNSALVFTDAGFLVVGFFLRTSCYVNPDTNIFSSSSCCQVCMSSQR